MDCQCRNLRSCAEPKLRAEHLSNWATQVPLINFVNKSDINCKEIIEFSLGHSDMHKVSKGSFIEVFLQIKILVLCRYALSCLPQLTMLLSQSESIVYGVPGWPSQLNI